MPMRDQTFMTIHNLTPEANILFASASVENILGYNSYEVRGRSCWDYFHPDEVPFARSVHSRGVLLDKAAVLHYARIRGKDGSWVNCECCFTVVYEVLVACISRYLGGPQNHRRALEAPQIQRIFSSSPRDPRYHMLEYLSPKFKMPPVEREPRAALLLSRFSINLPIMFATDAIELILGLTPAEIVEKPFYDCIQRNCLPDAIECLESAKSNESIAYLRFWYRDPRTGDDDGGGHDVDPDADNNSSNSSNSDSEGGGARLNTNMDLDHDDNLDDHNDHDHDHDAVKMEAPRQHGMQDMCGEPSNARWSGAAPHGPTPPTSWSTATTAAAADADEAGPSRRRPRQRQPAQPMELEAVVSCSSDALVVVLRRARPPVPSRQPASLPPPPLVHFENGLFAAPWGLRPIEPHYPPEAVHSFRAPLLPQYMPLRESVKQAGGPPMDQLMRSIQDVAVFAWALVGINGTLANYSRGLPRGGAQPPEGLPIWDPNAGYTGHEPPDCYPARRWAQTDVDQAHKASLRVGAYDHGGHGYLVAGPAAPAAHYAQTVSRTPRRDDTLYGGGRGSSAFHHPQTPAWPHAGPAYVRGPGPSYEQSLTTWQRTTPSSAFTHAHGHLAGHHDASSQHQHSLEHYTLHQNTRHQYSLQQHNHTPPPDPTRDTTHMASHHPPPHHLLFTPPASNESGVSYHPPRAETRVEAASMLSNPEHCAPATLPATSEAPNASALSYHRVRYMWQ